MPYVLGIDVGTSRTRAAVSRHTATGWSDPVPLPLSVPTVVHLAPNRAAVVGDEAARHADGDPTRIARGFVARIGDDVPLVLGGTPCTAQELAAVLIRWVAERIAEREGGPAERVVVTHPAGWGTHRTALLHHELTRQGLTGVTLLPEPVAVAEGHCPPLAVGALLAIYGLGSTTADAAVVRRTEDGFELVSHAEEPLGGSGFDDAILECVRAEVGSALDQLDPTEPAAWLALAQLRGSCAGAKELLSTEPEVIVPVGLPDGPVDTRITRADFERIVRPAVAAGVGLLPRVMRSAGVAPASLAAVVLAGGSVRIPLVAELVGAACPAKLVMGSETTVALGAAAAARRFVTGPDVPVVVTDGLAHTEVIERSAIALYAGSAALDPADVDAELGADPPPRPPVEVIPLDLPVRQWSARLLPRVRPAVLTVSTLVVVAIGVVLTFMVESGSGNHQAPSPLHLTPAANQSVTSTTP
jgi:molecular chaperone DnaK (HSP70)